MTTTDLLIDAASQWTPARHHQCAGEPGRRASATSGLLPPLARSVVGYQVRLAASAADVTAVGRLRRESVADETETAAGQLEYDDRSDHLIVWHQGPSGAPLAVGTARLLPPHANDANPRGAGLAADRQFGLRPLERLLNSGVEVGPICVHPGHRGGTAAALLLGGIARYQHLTGYRYLLGVLPIELGHDGRNAAAVWDLAVAQHLAPAGQRCRPRQPVPIGGLDRTSPAVLPALLTSFLRLGGKVLGPPALAENMRSAEVLLLLDLKDADRRYLGRLLRAHG